MGNQNTKNLITISRETTAGKFLAKQRMMAMKMMDEIRKQHKIRKNEKSSVEIIREFRERV